MLCEGVGHMTPTKYLQRIGFRAFRASKPEGRAESVLSQQPSSARRPVRQAPTNKLGHVRSSRLCFQAVRAYKGSPDK